MKSVKGSDTRKVEITWPGETGRGEGLTRSRQLQTAYETGRQLHRLPGSFMSQLRCALGSTSAWGAISWDWLGVTCALLLKFRRRNILNIYEQFSSRCVKMESPLATKQHSFSGMETFLFAFMDHINWLALLLSILCVCLDPGVFATEQSCFKLQSHGLVMMLPRCLFFRMTRSRTHRSGKNVKTESFFL